MKDYKVNVEAPSEKMVYCFDYSLWAKAFVHQMWNEISETASVDWDGESVERYMDEKNPFGREQFPQWYISK